MTPRVSILALCFNHESFLEEALLSLESLTYPNLEILVADDASTDQSLEILKKWKARHPDWTFVFNEQNKGNCKTFNDLLKRATGEFILDFATDDVMLPNGLEGWIRAFDTFPNTGFCYADALIFSTGSIQNKRHSSTIKDQNFPEGKILLNLFSPAFICPPAVLFRKSALLEIGGYDENLAYEDWDVWLRLSRNFSVSRYSQPVIRYRKHPDSLSASILKKRNQKHLHSTLIILKRAMDWEELKGNAVWVPVVRYHLKICGALQIPELAYGFFEILKKSGFNRSIDRFWLLLSKLPLPVHQILRFFLA